MTGLLRLSSVLGCSALITMGALVPGAANADTPAPGAPTSSATGAGAPAVPATPARTPSASTSYSLSPEEFGLTISPVRLAVAPDDIGKTQEVLAVNRGRSPLTVEVEKRNFTSDSKGALTYEENAPYAASTWVTVAPSHFELAPGATQVVTAEVAQPAGAEPGDHQFALLFFVPSGQGKGNVRIKRGLASPVFITVPGDLDDSVSLTGLSAPSFSRGGPVDVTASVHNLGNVHRDFRAPASLSVTSAGSATAFPDFTVPRDASRDISTSWDPPFMCVCHPSVSFANDGQPVQTQTVRVVVFPWHLFAILAGAVALLVLLVRSARRRYRASVNRAAVALTSSGSSRDG